MDGGLGLIMRASCAIRIPLRRKILYASGCAGLLSNASGECGIFASGRGAVAIARFEQEAGASYRVIGPDGVERNVVGIADWIAAIRSGEIDDGCLFFDAQAKRWRPLPTLELYTQAKSAPDESSNSRAARGRYAVVGGLLAALMILALAAWSAGRQADLQSLAHPIPPPALLRPPRLPPVP